MHQHMKARGLEQAVISFSVAHSSLSTAYHSPACASDAVDDDELHAEPLYLSLQQGEQVRVLRRECHHGRGPHGAPSHVLAATDGGAVLSQPQWCIAQREDGAIGLVPGSLLRRVSGVLSSAQPGLETVSMHSDRLQDPSSLKTPAATHHSTLEAIEKAILRGAAVLRPTQTTSTKAESRSRDMVDEDDEAADALQLQKRWHPIQKGQLNAFCDGASEILSAHRAARGTEMASDKDYSEKDEKRRIIEEEARVRAELHWLTDDLAPRLQVACTEAQAKLAKLQLDGRRTNAVSSSASSRGSADSPNPLEALDREYEQVTGLLEKVEALQNELGREASSDAVGEPQKLQPSSGRDATASSARCEVGESSARHDVTAQGLKAPGSYMVEKLRLLMAEEMETVNSYRSQKLVLQQRLSRLAELIQEVAAEEASLKESETALHELLGEQTSENVVDVAWPRALQGLTEEESAVLSASVHMFDKYTRKLQLLTDDRQCNSPTNAPSSSAEVSPLANSPTASAATAATRGTERNGVTTSTYAETPNRPTHSTGRASSMSHEKSTVATPISSRVEHLEKVLEKGDRDLAQLQEKLKAAAEFCDTYGPIARELEEQLKRGERILAEKKKYLADLQAAGNREALRIVC